MIVIAVQRVINTANSWSLSESDIKIDSVSSSSRRRLLAGSNVVYTVTGGASGIFDTIIIILIIVIIIFLGVSASLAETMITQAITNAVASGTFTTNLQTAYGIVGSSYTGTTSFASVSASSTPTFALVAVLTPSPTLNPTVSPTASSQASSQSSSSLIIGMAGMNQISLLLLLSLLLSLSKSSIGRGFPRCWYLLCLHEV